MKKIILLGLILSLVFVCGCNEDYSTNPRKFGTLVENIKITTWDDYKPISNETAEEVIREMVSEHKNACDNIRMERKEIKDFMNRTVYKLIFYGDCYVGDLYLEYTYKNEGVEK